MKKTSSNRNYPERAGETRKKILHAAIREFSTHGLAGARTDSIAESARVNKALLYYYFKSKSALYDAALVDVAETVAERTMAVFDPKYSAGERLLRAALNHFDRITAQGELQSLMQQEMVRVRLGERGAMPLLVKKFFKPVLQKFEQTVLEGIHTGELCPSDGLQVVYSMLGANVFYFLSAPMMRLALPFHPLNKASIASRRNAAIHFLGSALFADRARGAKLAKDVLATTPMPKLRKSQVWRKLS